MQRKIVLVLLVVLILSYVATAVKRQVTLLEGSKIKLVGGQINHLSLSSGQITIYLEVQNNTDFDITLLNQKYDIYLGDKYVTTIRKKRMFIPPGTSPPIPVIVNFQPQLLISTGLLGLAKGIKNLNLTIQGHANVATSVIVLSRLPVKHTIVLSELLNKKLS